MQYPIFQSIINTIEASLNEREIKVRSFKTWEESKINATGLEILIDLKDTTTNLDSLSINFDWDRFREAALARQLDGTDKHPVLQSEHFTESNILPVIDVEMSWNFKVDNCQPQEANEANHRIRVASEWMEMASRDVNELLSGEEIITRWHLEIDGDDRGKFLTAINLISYFQFSFAGLNSLIEVQKFTERRLIYLLYRAKRIIEIVDNSVVVNAA